MKVERICVRSRKELLLRIDGFLSSNGWSTHKIDDEKLLAKDIKGGGLTFNFIAHQNDPNYGYAPRSRIDATTDMDTALAIDAQPNRTEVAFFRFNNAALEFNDGYMIGDGSFFCLCLDIDANFQLFCCSGYIDKTHEFNGGRTIFGSIYSKYGGGHNWGGYTSVSIGHSGVVFSLDSANNIVSLGGEWRSLKDADLRVSKILTNLCAVNHDKNDKAYNELSALSARALLNIGKSALSGLYTLITPNFFYKNNQNIWVHAGALNEIRVLKETDKFTNGQILNLGSEKFMIFRPAKFVSTSNCYTMAVKIA